jgi:hypothetical protein
MKKLNILSLLFIATLGMVGCGGGASDGTNIVEKKINLMKSDDTDAGKQVSTEDGVSEKDNTPAMKSDETDAGKQVSLEDGVSEKDNAPAMKSDETDAGKQVSTEK